jgi:hypothetical protein
MTLLAGSLTRRRLPASLDVAPLGASFGYTQLATCHATRKEVAVE